MININNSVTNILGSPAFISCDLLDLPQPYDVAIGTFAVYNFDGAKYFIQSTGSTWATIDNGGSTSGIDTVLAVGQALTTTRQIDLANHTLQFIDSTQPNTDVCYFHYNDIRIGNQNQVILFIDDLTFKTQYNSTVVGINLNLDAGIYILGSEQNFLEISESKYLRTYFDGNKYGLLIDKSNNKCFLGDYDTGNSRIILDTSSNIITMENANTISIGNTFTSLQFNANIITLSGTNLQSTTAGGSSGKHLKITLNGIPYKIALNNV